jgi:hypothetical protein
VSADCDSRIVRVMAAKRVSTRPKGKASEAEEELGRMMAHCARLEREIAQLRKAETEWKKFRSNSLTPKAPSVAPKRAKSERPTGTADRSTPTVPPNLPSTEAIAMLRDGIHGLREVLISAAAQIDAFAKKQFDLFDPKVKSLLLLRTTLLKAAGQNAKVPPPVPRLSEASIDISELAEILESLRPAGASAVEVMVFPRPPRLGVSKD